MNENTELTIKVTDVAKYVSIAISAFITEGRGHVGPHRLKIMHLAVTNDIIAHNSIQKSIELFDKTIEGT